MSSSPRIFVGNDLDADTAFRLADGQSHYISKVMRLGSGDAIRVFNGRDGEWQAELTISGRVIEARPIEQLRAQPQATAAPHLMFAPLKKTRTDFAVEKATELGVSIVQPVLTERTQTHRVKTERLQALAQEAAEQTERLDVPDVRELMSLETVLQAWDPASPLIYCDEAGDDPALPWGGEGGRAPIMSNRLRELNDGRGGVLIGPEGGFSSEERDSLRSCEFVHAVSLGPRILRAETAIVSALTIWQLCLGDWR
ncbi:MAG: 16S rRNA (uracil(1498)-N(3))-methyltransferase [Pseudomonadota bacterium]